MARTGLFLEEAATGAREEDAAFGGIGFATERLDEAGTTTPGGRAVLRATGAGTLLEAADAGACALLVEEDAIGACALLEDAAATGAR